MNLVSHCRADAFVVFYYCCRIRITYRSMIIMQKQNNEKCIITLSANAGISINLCGTRIWVDALHNVKVKDYSTLDDLMLRKMEHSEAFGMAPDALIYTHCHEDHFSAELAEKVLTERPDVIAVIPEHHLSRQILAEGNRTEFDVGMLRVILIRLPHEGEEYRDIQNYGCLIIPHDEVCSNKGICILILGDSELGCSELTEHLAREGFSLCGGPGRKVDAVIADFPWGAVRRGRDPIEKLIRPDHLMLYHLPFEEDDERGYRSMIRRVISRNHNIPDIRILDEFLQTEIIQ